MSWSGVYSDSLFLYDYGALILLICGFFFLFFLFFNLYDPKLHVPIFDSCSQQGWF